MNVSRRGLIVGLGTGLVCAPAIVRASSLMKIRPLPELTVKSYEHWDISTQFLRSDGVWVPVLDIDNQTVRHGGLILMERAPPTIRPKLEWKRAANAG